MTEEGDDVVAEGSVRAQKRDGDALNLRFCGVFVMQAGKIQAIDVVLDGDQVARHSQAADWHKAEEP